MSSRQVQSVKRSAGAPFSSAYDQDRRPLPAHVSFSILSGKSKSIRAYLMSSHSTNYYNWEMGNSRPHTILRPSVGASGVKVGDGLSVLVELARGYSLCEQNINFGKGKALCLW